MALEDIAIVVAPAVDASPAEEGLSGNAPAILREAASLLERLADEGESGAIDLSSLPLTPADRLWLRERLGQGEVSIHLAAGGDSDILETAVPGLWWVEHRDEQGRVLSEFIEVTRVPALVAVPADDLESGLEYLDTLIDELD